MRTALAALLLSALLAGCLAGKPEARPLPTGQIDGAVVDELLNPFGNHTVTLVQLDRTDQTSARGGFSFRQVPPGFYTVTTSLGEVSSTQVVDVQAGRVTRVILQLLPVVRPDPYFEAFSFQSTGEAPEAGGKCASCSWTVELDQRRPAEVTLDAIWASGLLDVDGEHDHLAIKVLDDRGFTLYSGSDLASPAVVSIAGADIHPDARSLRVEVTFGPQFMPSAQDFTMRTVVTLYHGATKAEMYGIVP